MSDYLTPLSKEGQECAERCSMPKWLDPTLARLSHDYFDDENWLYEPKLDGERVLAYVNSDGKVKLYTRNQKDLTDSYPEIADALASQMPVPAILDGEVVALDTRNVSDFQRLQPRMQASDKKEAKATGVQIHYYIFDCLYINEHKVTACSLHDRKRLLKNAVAWLDPLRWTPYRVECGLRYYEEACDKGWEGVIAKDGTAAYTHGRSSAWLKFKCFMQQEFVIGGYTAPQGEREGFGALLLGYYCKGKLIYAGQVGTGFDEKTLAQLHAKLQSKEQRENPFSEELNSLKNASFVEPAMVCEVAFTEWTEDGKLRHPRYEGLRRDKKARDVVRETQSQRADLETDQGSAQ
ncbi:non-homologous end-joining DNA ligase [Aliidiomarina sp. Khilg15.8]